MKKNLIGKAMEEDDDMPAEVDFSGVLAGSSTGQRRGLTCRFTLMPTFSPISPRLPHGKAFNSPISQTILLKQDIAILEAAK